MKYWSEISGRGKIVLICVGTSSGGAGKCCVVAGSKIRPASNLQALRQQLFHAGDLKVGCLREVRVVSGLPATSSTERLDILDKERHILSFSIVGGDHRLINYRSITTLHERLINGKPGTLVIESYMVDVPQGNTREETCLFVETIIETNLHSLARISKCLVNTQCCF
eukprot:PITA_30393